MEAKHWASCSNKYNKLIGYNILIKPIRSIRQVSHNLFKYKCQQFTTSVAALILILVTVTRLQHWPDPPQKMCQSFHQHLYVQTMSFVRSFDLTMVDVMKYPSNIWASLNTSTLHKAPRNSSELISQRTIKNRSWRSRLELEYKGNRTILGWKSRISANKLLFRRVEVGHVIFCSLELETLG